jgi:hypothetical protein
MQINAAAEDPKCGIAAFPHLARIDLSQCRMRPGCAELTVVERQGATKVSSQEKRPFVLTSILDWCRDRMGASNA